MIVNIIREVLQEELSILKGDILESIQTSKETSRYLTRKQVAQYMNIGLSTVDYWSRLGKLTKIQIDGSVRFDKVELDNFLTLKKEKNV